MKIAIFGGAFNPPHIEHINMINALLLNGYDKVVIVPSSNPPHKNCRISFEHRINMLKLATKDIKNIEICDIENTDKDVHYSFETIPKLQKIYGKFSFVMGGDSLIDLHKWKNPDKIVKMCDIVVFFRGGNKQKFEQAYKFWTEKGAKIKVMEYYPKNISSTRLRFLMECGYYDGVLPDVAEYIKTHKLYMYYSKYIKKLRKDVDEKTFEHSVRVVQCALYYNEHSRLKIDTEKIFLSALLHDCAKQLVHKKHGVRLLPKDSIGTSVEHQFLGSIIAKKKYKITDFAILNAIKYHTTGNENMDILQKLIFCADMLEEKRDFDSVVQLRQTIKTNFELGFKKCLLQQYNYLLTNNKNEIYPLTKSAVEYYEEI